MTVHGFDELADLALRKSGHAFRPNQVYLLESRLSEILRRESFSELGELADCLKARPNPVLENEIVTAMLSKETRFFDDRKTLQALVDERIPKLAKSQEETGETRPIRIWCAGGGSGQEAYSLAILLDEANAEERFGRSVEIVSTDICKWTTEKAVHGIYDHYEIQFGLSAKRMLKYFTKADNDWKANASLRERVTFEVQNLMEPFDAYERFDIILCRNVLGALLSPIATDIVKRLGPVLSSGGTLLLAPGETLPVDTGMFRAEGKPNFWHFDPSHQSTAAVA